MFDVASLLSMLACRSVRGRIEQWTRLEYGVGHNCDTLALLCGLGSFHLGCCPMCVDKMMILQCLLG
jgi:hypothetical protein